VLRLTASDGALATSADVTVVVNDAGQPPVNTPPQMAAIGDRIVAAGMRLQVALQAFDADGDTLTYALPGAPAGATLDPAPLFDWTPSGAQVGVHPITAQVSDPAGHTTSVSFKVTVLALANTPPSLAPQGNETLAIGAPFTRALAASDPDAGEALTYSLIASPAGMTLTGGVLSWSTTGKPPGDYPVTVRVTDRAGAFDQKGFVVTLQSVALPRPVAKDDSYVTKPGGTLTVAAPGVLGNDENPAIGTLAAQKVTDPSKGTLAAFGADGSFTYVAPSSTAAPVSLEADALVGSFVNDSTGYAFSADLNDDGAADVVTLSFGVPIATDGKTGARLWTGWDASASSPGQNCGQYLFGTDFALGDVDGSGGVALVAGTHCDAKYTAGVSTRLIALDTDPARAVSGAAAVKWVSERLDVQVPLPPSVGAPPVPTYLINPAENGLASFATPTLARITPGGGVKTLTRILIQDNTFPYDSDGDGSRDKNASCYAATGNVADQGKGCQVTFVLNAATGAKELVLTAPNPYNQGQTFEWEPMRQTAPVVADLDGDGQVEILSGNDVYKYDGTKWSLAWQATLPGITSFYEPLSVSVADVDGDGNAEVILQAEWTDSAGLHRGFLTYRHDGALTHRFEPPTWGLGLPSIADVDGDGISEILFAARGIVYAYRPDGALVWASQFPDDDPALHPDDDPSVRHWPAPASERTGPSTGLQVYDLDLDGRPEIVVVGSYRVAIFDGRTGRLLSSVHSNAAIRNHVVPLVVDANGDGHADIIAASGVTGVCAGCPAFNTMVFSGVDRNWAPVALVLNQMSYNPWAVDDAGAILYDGGVHRSFRVQRQRGTVVDPRTRDSDAFTYAATGASGTSTPAKVTVAIAPQNSPPVITSTPPTSLFVVRDAAGAYPTFVYQVAATDPDVGDTVRYELVFSSVDTNYFPQATVDPVTGVMRMFTGPCGSFGGPCDFGPMLFIVAAVDSFGARTEQGFVVDVTSQPRTVPAVVGQLVKDAKTAIKAVQLEPRVIEVYDTRPLGTVVAQNPVGGTVVARSTTVLISVSKGPQPVTMPYVVGKSVVAARSELAELGFSIDVTGQASMTVPAGTVMAQSPAYGTIVVPTPSNPAALTVSTGAPLAAAIAKIVVAPGSTRRVAGDDVTYKATAVLADATARDITYAATWASSQAGTATILSAGRVHAAHAGVTSITASMNGVTGASALTVVAPTIDNDDPTAIIATPADGQAVTGPVSVTGTATDPNVLRYELAFAADGDEAFTPIAEGSAPVSGGTLGTFDPTVLRNGVYTLELTVVDRGGNTAAARTSVTVEGSNKVGAFTLAYTDLTVPLPGMPVEIVRTYDSRHKGKGDFGIGWTLGLKALRVASTRAPGESWQVYKSGLNYELDARSNRYIAVTLPNGRVETFDLKVTPSTSPLVPFQTVKASVVTRPGNQGTLEILSNTDLLIVDPQPGPVTLIDDATLKAFDPDLFRYRQRDGTEFVVTRSRGVTSVKDANGNAITLTPGGIAHSSGLAVSFARDSEERIVAITDTTGAVRSYAYSGEGDLSSATDRTGRTTKWFYDRLHGVVRIEDPLGRIGTRTEYDESGRVVSITDGNGHTTNYTHDILGRQEQIEDALGRVTVYTYDERGNVTAKTNALGHTTTAQYDARDRITKATDTLGGVRTFVWDDNDNLTQVTDALGRTRSMAYDAAANLLTETDALGRTSRFTYDARNNRVGTLDAAGRATTVTFDAAGNMTKVAKPGGGSVAVTYDASGQPSAMVDEAHRTTTFAYDGRGGLVKQASAGGGAATVAYDAEGRLTGSAQGGRATALAYDAAGTLSSVTSVSGRALGVRSDDAGRFTGFAGAGGEPLLAQTYDAVGNVASATDAAGVKTSYEYDALNRPVKTTLASGAVETRSYNAAGGVLTSVDARGSARAYEWDTVGNLLSVTDPLGGVTRYTYDAAGNALTMTDALGRVTQYTYDVLDRVTRVTYPDGTFEEQSFDDAGNMASRTDVDGVKTSLAYDAMRRLVSVTDANGGSLAHQYAADGGIPTRSVDARGAVTLRTFDGYGRLLTTTFPDGGVETNAYDGAGNLLSRRNAAGEVTTWQYDDDGRVVLVSLSDGSTQAFTYTPDGRRATVTDTRGTTTFSYDALARLSRVTDPSGAYVRYEYDAAGLRTRVAHGDGGGGGERVLDYAYDALGRVVRMTDSGGGVTLQSFDAVGNLVGVTYPNGVTATLAYDVRDRIREITYRNAGGTVLARETYTRNGAGHVTRMDRADGSRVDYAYDSLRRVVGETVLAPGGSIAAQRVYAYDAAGNRTTAGDAGAPASFVYDAAGRLVSGAGFDYAYDAAGRRIEKRWLDAGVQRTARYRWDSLGSLRGFENGSGGTWSYGYDVDGLRVRKAGPEGDTAFLIDRDAPDGFAKLLRATRAGHTQTFDWMNGLAATREDGVASWPLADALGSVRAMTGASAAITDAFDYDAFGRITARTGASAALHRFAGEPFDAESELTYLRARYYDPRTGAFLSRDPLAPPLDSTQGANAYLYALANPVNRRDPGGKETIAELGVSQTINSTLDKSRVAYNTRKAMAQSLDVFVDAMRVYGGAMAIQTVANSIANGFASAQKWFGISGVARLALDAFADELGEGANATIGAVATAALAKTGFDMLGGRNVEIHVEGLGVLLASSLDEAQSSFRADASAASKVCAQGDLAYASRAANAIAICREAIRTMPPLPRMSTLTTPNHASLAGILLHEYTHLSLKTRDQRYSCHPEGARVILQQLAGPALLALGNADSYRCWAEEYTVGTPLPWR
jgi:RHS repeat-associated protein